MRLAIKHGNVRLLMALIFSILILTFIFSTSLKVVSANQTELPEVDVQSKTVHRGQTFSIDVNLSNNSGLISMFLTVDYDETAMTLTNVIQGSALSSMKYTTTNVETEQGYSIKPFNILWDGKDIDNTNGLLVTLVFDSNIEAPIGEYPITLTYDKQNTNSAYKTPIDLNINNGVVELISGEFEAIYQDYDGTILYQHDYNADDIPAYPLTLELPFREEDDMYAYEFIGWKGVVSDDVNTLIFEANYKLTAKIYTLFFYIDGINGKPDGIIDETDYYKSIDLAYKELIDIEAPDKQYYEFFGWFADENYLQYAPSTMPAHNTRLYGYYEFEIRENNIPTISLNAEYTSDTYEEVCVTASLIYNPGFNAMVLTLKYDKDVFTFDRFEDLEVLSSMQSDKTNTTDLSIDNFKFYYEGVENNYETGAFLKLYFKVKPGAVNGTYEVGFTYNEYQDATYYDRIQELKYTKLKIYNSEVPVGEINHWNEEFDNGIYIDITSDDGKPINVYINIDLITEKVNLDKEVVNTIVGDEMFVSSAYQIKMLQNGAEIQPNTMLTIRIKLTEEEKRNKIKFYSVDKDNNLEEVEFNIENGTLVFKTNNLLANYAIFRSTSNNNYTGPSVGGILFNVGMPIVLAIATMLYALRLKQKMTKMKKKEDE